MPTTLELVSIGNSQGVRLPKVLLRRYGFDKEIQIIETPEGILLKPVDTGKLSWAETFAASAKETQSEAENWAGTLSEGLDSEEFGEWAR